MREEEEEAYTQGRKEGRGKEREGHERKDEEREGTEERREGGREGEKEKRREGGREGGKEGDYMERNTLPRAAPPRRSVTITKLNTNRIQPRRDTRKKKTRQMKEKIECR